MSRISLILVGLAALLGPPAHAAPPQGFNGEKSVMITGKIIDAQCAILGDCPADCGAGKRQLGLLTHEKVFYLAAKVETPFAGALAELLPHCGKTLSIDGLSVSANQARILYIDKLRESPQHSWVAPAAFLADWAKRHGFAANGKEAEEWWNFDRVIKAHIDKFGKTGVASVK